eukprot:m.264124 g.264124  ORF g.264124 m.264124 type:complete len:368 (+) comp54070_c0_seq1:176-1279(+)
MLNPDLVLIGSLAAALMHTGWNTMLCCRHGDIGAFLLGSSIVVFIFLPYLCYALAMDQIAINQAGPYFAMSGLCRCLAFFLTARIYRLGELSLTQSLQGVVSMITCIVALAISQSPVSAVDIVGIAFIMLGMIAIACSLGVRPNREYATDEIEMNEDFSPMGSPTRSPNGLDVVIDPSEPSYESNPFAKIKRIVDKRRRKGKGVLISKASQDCTVLRWQGAGWTIFPALFFAAAIHIDCLGVKFWEPVAYSLSSTTVSIVLMWCIGVLWRSDEISVAWTVAWKESKANVIACGFLFVLAHILLLISMKEVDVQTFSTSVGIYLGTVSLVSLLLGWWYCDEPFSKHKTIGLGLSAVGVLVMIVDIFYT